MEISTLLNEAKRLAERLTKFEESLRRYYDAEKNVCVVKNERVVTAGVVDAGVVDAGAIETCTSIFDVLSVPLCKLTKMVVPDVQRKIDEIVYADLKGMKVCEGEHGADLVDVEGNNHELKVSSCKKGTNYKCNFNWPIPAGSNVERRREKLLASIVEKTGGNSNENVVRFSRPNASCDAKRQKEKGGGFEMVAKDARGQDVLNEYSLSGIFVYHYFKRLPKFPTSTTYNFGCERCYKCNEYHRLQRLVRYDERMLERLKEHFSSIDSNDVRWTSGEDENERMNEWVPWDDVFETTKAHCK